MRQRNNSVKIGKYYADHYTFAAMIRSWWFAAWFLLLGAAGLALLAPKYFPKKFYPGKGQVMRIISFNVSGSNTRLGEIETWLYALRADIVFLQELPVGYAVESIAALKDPYPYQMREPPYFRSYGNMILSRFPVIYQEYIPTSQSNAHYWLQKAIIKFDKITLAVYNAHFIKPIRLGFCTSSALDYFLYFISCYDDNERNRQIQHMLQIITSEKNAYIVAGDFNMSPYSKIYAEVAARMADTFAQSGQGLGATWPVFNHNVLISWLPALVRIDYIWHSGDFRTLNAAVGHNLGSDHLPILATIELRHPGREIR